MIPFNKPTIDENEKNALLRVLDSGHWTAGKEVEAFEKEFAEYIGAPYVIAVDNCTNALFLALQYFKRNAWVKCPAITFASVANVILQTGSQVEFTDEYHAGSAYQLGYTNIWDCAHEIRRRMYQKEQVQCFSFYPNKVLSSAEGGAIATDNKEFYEWVKLARQNGRYSRSFSDYDIDFVGWKMNMTDIQAALAREQLKKLDGFLERRQQICDEYRKHFEQVNKWNYLFVILVKNRKLFMERLADEGIEISYHYKPLYDQKAYQKINHEELPYTESIKNNIVTLPCYPGMSDDEVQKVIKLTKLYQNEA